MQTESEIIKLSELPTGRLAILMATEEDPVFNQLMSMGCIPGEEIIVKRVGVFGDPIAFKIGEATISIRLEDAQNINVQILEDAKNI